MSKQPESNLSSFALQIQSDFFFFCFQSFCFRLKANSDEIVKTRNVAKKQRFKLQTCEKIYDSYPTRELEQGGQARVNNIQGWRREEGKGFLPPFPSFVFSSFWRQKKSWAKEKRSEMIFF
jgi:hypothetical protein